MNVSSQFLCADDTEIDYSLKATLETDRTREAKSCSAIQEIARLL